MQLLVLTSLLLACAIAAPAGPYEGVGAIYKGPDSETVIKGPDGSRITSKAEGAALEELKPIVGPAPPKAEKPKVEIKGAKAKATAGKEADEAAEEVVGIAEEVVAKRPKADAVIFALQEPEGYALPNKGEVEFEQAGKGGYWGEGEEEDEGEYEEGEEEGDYEKEEYEPFVIKA